MSQIKEHIPKLRFPEFEREWDGGDLKSLLSKPLQNGVFNNPKKVGSGYKLINVKDMYGKSPIDVSLLSLLELSEKEFESNKVEKGDVFFTRSSLVKEGIAHSNLFLSENLDVTYDGHLIKMTPNQNKALSIFLHYLFKTNLVRKQLIAKGKTATMTTIGQKDVESSRLVFPLISEQQKIASFLTSVDEKISNLERKKSLLSDYKKGVMQQFFSQQLRFKDDQGNEFPDWEDKKLGDISNSFSGGTPVSSNVSYYNGNINFIGSGDIKKAFVGNLITEDALNNSSAKLVNKGDLLYALYGATSGECSISKMNGAINQAVMCIRFEGNTSFLYYYLFLERNRIVSTYLQGGQGNLSGKIINSLKIKIPCPDEQQKIADFLTALDSKISLVIQKLTQAQSFKKGLLQQMFV